MAAVGIEMADGRGGGALALLLQILPLNLLFRCSRCDLSLVMGIVVVVAAAAPSQLSHLVLQLNAIESMYVCAFSSSSSVRSSYPFFGI